MPAESYAVIRSAAAPESVVMLPASISVCFPVRVLSAVAAADVSVMVVVKLAAFTNPGQCGHVAIRDCRCQPSVAGGD